MVEGIRSIRWQHVGFALTWLNLMTEYGRRHPGLHRLSVRDLAFFRNCRLVRYRRSSVSFQDSSQTPPDRVCHKIASQSRGEKNPEHDEGDHDCVVAGCREVVMGMMERGHLAGSSIIEQQPDCWFRVGWARTIAKSGLHDFWRPSATLASHTYTPWLIGVYQDGLRVQDATAGIEAVGRFE